MKRADHYGAWAAIAIVTTLALLNVAGCAQTMTTPLPPPVVRVVCPPIKSYTDAQQTAMAQALVDLPDGSPLVQVLADYGVLRASLRACHG